MSEAELSCREFVELVTEYLEGGLTGAERIRFEEHLAECAGCVNYVDQIRTTISLTGHVTADDLTNEVKAELLAAFRDWKPG